MNETAQRVEYRTTLIRAQDLRTGDLVHLHGTWYRVEGRCTDTFPDTRFETVYPSRTGSDYRTVNQLDAPGMMVWWLRGTVVADVVLLSTPDFVPLTVAVPIVAPAPDAGSAPITDPA